MATTKISYEHLKNCLQKGISFAAYTLPGETTFNFIAQKTQATEIDLSDVSKSGFVIHPFDSNSDHPILLLKDDFFLQEGDNAEDFNTFINSFKSKIKPNYKIIKETSKEDYFKLFNTFKKSLDSGKFDKLVLSRVKNIEAAKNFDIVELFQKINHHYPDPFNHISYTPQSGIWLGATPETLLSITSGKARTVALAGTQKKNLSSEYKWEEKEIEEQKFVVNFVRNILEKEIPASSIQTTNETIEAGEMVHLKTNFNFSSKEIKNLTALINNLHPTPAVCGLPKEEAKQFILQNEVHDRVYYTGFLGPLNLNQQTHLFVNLRCLNFSENKLSLYLGGGLTKSSIREKEWEETELKATTLQSLL